jgi:glucose/arabinose dehydrogenase
VSHQRVRRPVGLVATLALAVAAAGCSAGEPEPEIPSTTQPTTATPDGTHESPSASRSPSDRSPTSPSDGRPGHPVVAGAVAEGLRVPWGIDFLPDGSAVVTERDTRRVLRVDATGSGPAEVTELGVVDEAVPAVEGGLLGVAVSPDFAEDRWIYLYATTGGDNRVLRARLSGDRLGEPEVVLDGIPAGAIHDGGRLEFGPDGHLDVSTGEVGEESLAQDPDSLGGKVLRITPEGRPAPGNPDPGSPVWSLGHRNVQGLAFDDRDRLWASEFGDQTFDELNLLEPGANYGWPQVEGTGGGEGFTDPQVTWSTDEASPSGLAWHDGALWLGALQGERLWRVTVRGGRAVEPTPFFVGEYGRLRTVVTTPDGDLWVTTSNHDGRGSPAAEDDRILLVRSR